MLKTLTRLILWTLLLWPLIGCSLKTEIQSEQNDLGILNCHDENNPYSIVGGTSVSNEDPDSKKAVLLIIRKGSKISSCTGALLSDRVVITAAHCVKGADKTEITAIFHPKMTCASGYDRTSMALSSEDFISHEKYDGNTKGVDDLALVRLRAPAPAAYPRAQIYDGISPRANEILMIGYGVTSEWNEDSLELRKTFKNFKKEGLVIDHHIAFLQNTPSGGVCQGDSGGPIYVKTPAGDRIIGVNSIVAGKGDDTVCHELSFGMYTPFYSTWIQENLLKLQ